MSIPTTIECNSNVLVEDLFDGWLVVPGMGDLLHGHKTTLVSKSTFVEELMDNHVEPTVQSPQLAKDALENKPLQNQQEDIAPVTTQITRTRREHNKSRLGCISCKQRKIKCSETRPSCTNCTKRGTMCRYSSGTTQRTRHESRVTRPRLIASLSDTPTVCFSADDMRLFHHYMISAYPCTPHEYEFLWTKDVPTYSHQYPYLMHAMLGVAGSHLDLQIDRPKLGLALTHRQKAISGLQKAFARWPPPAHEAHIMLATAYLLAFQAGYLVDGLLDHVLAFRGCASLSKLILTSGMSGPFVVHANYHKMTNLIKCRHFLPRLDQAIASEALYSISRFSHLLATPTTHAIDKALVAQLVEAVRALLETEPPQPPAPSTTEDSQTHNSDREAPIPFSPPPSPANTPQDRNPDNSYLHILPDNPYLHIRESPSVAADPVQAFANIDWETITTPPSPRTNPHRSLNALMSAIGILSNWPHDSLLHLFSPTNMLSTIVMAHFLAIRLIIQPLSAPRSSMRTPARAMIEWVGRSIKAVDEGSGEEGWSEFVRWPRKVAACLKACVERNRGLTFGDICQLLHDDPGAFREGRVGRV